MEDGAVGVPPFKASLNNRRCSELPSVSSQCFPPPSCPSDVGSFHQAYFSVTDNENAGNDPFSRHQMTMTAATECLDQMARGAIALKARPGAICASGFSRAQ